MKTKPDEATLTRWMDGELEGDDLQRVNTWAQAHPEILTEHASLTAMRASIKEHIPASIEPPYADFFNQRILSRIDNPVPSSPHRSKRNIWQWLAMPVAAAAMTACFYMGTQIGETPGMKTTDLASTVYAPDGSVSAAMFKSEDTGATVILLEGLEDIPDEIDMVARPSNSMRNSVAANTSIIF